MDPIIVAGGTKLAEIAAEKAIQRTLKLGWRKISWLPITHIRSSEKVRVACSAFLRIHDEHQRFLLIRNLHRPEFFGPLGGCYKYLDGNGSQQLERFFFGSDGAVKELEAHRDIRGYIRRGKTAEFFEWFQSGAGRESYRECLIRELREELFGECSIALPSELRFDSLSFRLARAFLERSYVQGTGIRQFRLFEVYDLDFESSASQELNRVILGAKSDQLIWVTREEIELGRHAANRAVLGHAAVLFVNDTMTRADLPSHAKS